MLAHGLFPNSLIGNRLSFFVTENFGGAGDGPPAPNLGGRCCSGIQIHRLHGAGAGNDWPMIPSAAAAAVAEFNAFFASTPIAPTGTTLVQAQGSIVAIPSLSTTERESKQHYSISEISTSAVPPNFKRSMGIPRERDLRGHYVQLLDFLAEYHGRYDLDRAWFDRLEAPIWNLGNPCV